MSNPDNTSDYLVALNEALATRLDRAERILTEIDDYLQSDIAERMSKGTSRSDAERAAIAQLGPPDEVARRFGSDPAGSFHQGLWRNWERFDRWSPGHPWARAFLFPVLPATAYLLVMTIASRMMFSAVEDASAADLAMPFLSLLCIFLAFGSRNRVLFGRREPGLRRRVAAWSAEHPWLAAATVASLFVGFAVQEIYEVVTGGGGGIFISLMGLGIFFSAAYGYSHPSCLASVGEIPAPGTRTSSRPKWLATSFRFLNDHWFPAILLIHSVVSGDWVIAGLVVLIFSAPTVMRFADRYLRGSKPRAAGGGRYSRWSRAHPFLGTLSMFSIAPATLLLFNLIDSGPASLSWMFFLFTCALMLSVIWLFSRKASKDSLPRDLTTEANNI